MQWEFATYPEFIEEYRTYHYDECSSCGANCELGESDVECVIEDKKMYFQQLLVKVFWLWENIFARTFKKYD